MAIEGFAESLLSDVRERNDARRDEERRYREKQEKKWRKEQREQAALGLGLNLLTNVGNSFVRNQTNEFLKNEQFVNNSLTVQNATSMQGRYLARQQQLEKSGMAPEEFFFKQAAPLVDMQMAKTDYNSGAYSQSDVVQAKALMASKLGEQLREAHEKQKAASERLALKDISYSEYLKEVRQYSPQTMGGWLAKKLRGVFTEGGEDPVTASARLAGMVEGAEDEKQYFDIYAKTGDAFTALEIKEVLKDSGHTIGKVPVSFDEAVKIPVYDPVTGSSREISVMYPKVNGRIVGVPVDALTGKEYKGDANPFQKMDIFQRLANMPAEQVEAARSRVVSMGESSTKYIEKAAKHIVGDPDRKDAIAERQKYVFGPIAITSSKLQNRYKMAPENAWQAATEMHNIMYKSVYEDSEPDWTHNPMPDGVWNPIVAVMAFHKIRTEGRFRSRIDADVLDAYEKALLESIDEHSLPTDTQLIEIIGTPDGKTKGLIHDRRYKNSALFDKVLKVGGQIRTQNRNNSSSVPEHLAQKEEKQVQGEKEWTNADYDRFVRNTPELSGYKNYDPIDKKIVVDRYRAQQQAPELTKKFIEALKRSYKDSKETREFYNNVWKSLTEEEKEIADSLDPQYRLRYLRAKGGAD